MVNYPIQADDLPQPGVWTERVDREIRHSDGQRSGMVLTSLADPQRNRRVFRLTWRGVPPAVRDAVWSHYQRWALGEFLWAPPGKTLAEALSVRWLTPPEIAFVSPVYCDVTGELEQVQLTQ